MSFPARISLVTLGVADLERSAAFYGRLGFVRKARQWEDQIVFFALDNLVLGLFPRAALAADAMVADTPPGFSGVTLAINLESEARVDAVFEAALAAGATSAKPPRRAEWGGYGGYVADPDGHLWELAFNPLFPLDETGRVTLPD